MVMVCCSMLFWVCCVFCFFLVYCVVVEFIVCLVSLLCLLSLLCVFCVFIVYCSASPCLLCIEFLLGTWFSCFFSSRCDVYCLEFIQSWAITGTVAWFRLWLRLSVVRWSKYGACSTFVRLNTVSSVISSWIIIALSYGYCSL